ncbi:MAG: CPBP family intramembrane metalloprotease [Defluviitaleaceae bacterium]|nr:CPBP family intramembrane metalloprotease [Defluviitaleaceae bacterium]
MYIFFLVLMVAYYVIQPLIVEALPIKKPLDSPLVEKDRVVFYIKLMASSWGTVLVILKLCLLAGISFYDVGIRRIGLNQSVWFTAGTLIACGIYIIAHIYGTIALLINPKYRKEQQENLVKNSSNGATNNLLPRSKKERKYWFFVSLTAGICEEIIFRGFLFFLFQAAFPNMPMLLVLLIASFIFGAAHAYQGIKGIRNTAIVGALHGVLFLVTGSLIPSMFMHFIVDIAAVFLLSEDIKKGA